MLIKKMTLIFLLTSCTLFKVNPSLKGQNELKLLDAIKLTGEGTGRLSLGQRQYLFGVDSLLKSNHDWVLAVTIPLQGEEIMILPNLNQKEASFQETESFEERIDKEFRQIKLNKVLSSEEFIKALRSLVRFNLSSHWGGEKYCKAQKSYLICEYDGDTFQVTVLDNEINIEKALGEGRSLNLNGKNLTESFFKQTSIHLYANEAEAIKKQSSFSLELFWKN